MGARVLIVAIAGSAALAYGCEKVSTKYCGMHKTDVENCGYQDAAIDAPPPCMSDNDCTMVTGLPRCDVAAGMCVQCLGSGDCSGSNAICNVGTHMCTGCVTNADCMTSGACLLNGTCADTNAVVYVDGSAGSNAGMCTKAAPCKTITFAQTVAAGKTIYKLANTITDVVALPAGGITFIGDPTSKVMPSGAMDVFTLAIGADVTMVGVTIDCNGVAKSGLNAMGSTMRLHHITITGCGKPGILTAMGGTLDLYGSTLAANTGGGVIADKNTSIDLENNFIVHNGSLTVQSGGVTWPATTAGNSVFQFNTVVDNQTMKGDATHAAGFACAALTAPMPNNIIARNTDATGSADTLLAGCDFSGSLMDLTNVHFAGSNDYHLMSTSTGAIDKAPDGAPSIDTDVDGQHRPFGSGKDYGADEYTR